MSSLSASLAPAATSSSDSPSPAPPLKRAMPLSARAEKALVASLRTHVLLHVARRWEASRPDRAIRRSWASEQQMDFFLRSLFSGMAEEGVPLRDLGHRELLELVTERVDAQLEKDADMLVATRGEPAWDQLGEARDPARERGLIETAEEELRIADDGLHEDLLAGPPIPSLPAGTAARARHSARPDDGVTIDPHLYVEQLKLEAEAVELAAERYRAMAEELNQMGRGSSLKPSQKVLLSWYTPLVAAIDAELSSIAAGEPGPDRKAYGPYLRMLAAPELTCIVMHETLNHMLVDASSALDGVPFTRLALAVGRGVNAEVNLKSLRRDKALWRTVQRAANSPEGPGGGGGGGAGGGASAAGGGAVGGGGPMLTAQLVNRFARRADPSSTWSSRVAVKVGAALLQRMLSVATVAVSPNRPEFRRGRHKNGDERPSALDWATIESSLQQGEQQRQQPPQEAEDGEGPAPCPTTDEEARVAVELEESASAAASTPAEHEGDEFEGAALGGGLITPPKVKTTKRGQRMEPAFVHDMVPMFLSRGRQSHLVGVIRCHPAVLNLVREGHIVMETLSPRHLPMLVPPRPWTSPAEGGYLSINTRVMRTRGSKRQAAVIGEADMDDVYRGLNSVGAVPWRVNGGVLDTMERVWADGGGLCELPAREDLPPPPEPEAPESAEPGEWRAYRHEARRRRKLNRDLHSLRCDLEYKLEVARSFRSRDQFFFPYNLDFRGRVYPVPPHLNHLGSDIARGLLTFARARPLGPRGLRWLKVHLSNLCGNDKASFDDRVLYAESRLRDAVEVARDPLAERNRWWQTVESPWQCLATCLELAAALESGDPESYESSLPVHQDGSCNGLQHYAALGRDQWGGEAVNLTPSPRPQDVYSGVCDLVNRTVEEDAESGDPLARRLLGHVKRKVVKQTVMTSVYGVTFIGARQQLLNRLNEVFPEITAEDKAANFRCANYLARTTLAALGDMFSGAREIMDWLGDVAYIMATHGQPVSWITPLGLPVVQPYRRTSSVQVQTLTQKVVLADHNDLLPVSRQRQRSAFPPNFVHSLDSTHMIMTALECDRLGICFASVHDSYWTHAGTVDDMNDALRRQFVRLYERPILEDLRETLVLRFPGVDFPPVPARGKLDLRQVLKAPYFFN